MTASPAPWNATPVTVRPVGDDPARVAAMLVAAWTEVRSGQRPLHQLRALVSPAAMRRLAAQAPPRVTARNDRVRVQRVVARSPRPGACEAVVLVRSQGRVTAVAVRLERHLGRWRAVELTAPEAGLAALPTASLPDGYRCRDTFDDLVETATPA